MGASEFKTIPTIENGDVLKPYTVAVEIDLPRTKVLELFDSSENLFKWQNGLQSFKHLSGEPGQVGAKSELVYFNDGKKIELVETITLRDFPDRFDGHYQWGGGSNHLENRFIELDENRTRWESTCSYEFSSLFLKLMGMVMPGAFKKQNQKFLDNFKDFCENGTSVQET